MHKQILKLAQSDVDRRRIYMISTLNSSLLTNMELPDLSARQIIVLYNFFCLCIFVSLKKCLYRANNKDINLYNVFFYCLMIYRERARVF